ncbi:hypothetical protein DOU18_07220 [Clavibacter michiganensis subsp. michiganensis]|nr:hypothetical protein [Clavibacter michiganensis subsp. michiganensis]
MAGSAMPEEDRSILAAQTLHVDTQTPLGSREARFWNRKSSDGEPHARRQVRAMAQSNLTPVVSRTFTDAMEQLQEGYISSIAATAGATVQNVSRDMHKYDLELVRQPSISLEEVAVKAQLKATTQLTLKPGATHFNYRFEKRQDYDSLAMARKNLKYILVVMLVHPDQRRWTFGHSRAMLTRHACYWLYLEGLPAPSSPKQPVVSIPRANVFNSHALSGILDRIEAGLTP